MDKLKPPEEIARLVYGVPALSVVSLNSIKRSGGLLEQETLHSLLEH